MYPAPAGTRALPMRRGEPRNDEQRSRVSGEEEWAWLRPLRESDSPRSVAWKAYARGGPLLVAHYDAPAGVHRLLDFALLQALPLEQRLSQLAQWVLDCERLGEAYACSCRSGRCRPGTASRSNAPASKRWRCIRRERTRRDRR